jgi:quercetin dioxygenase-like cupin family protein
MANRIHDPDTGQTITFLITARESGGKLLRMAFLVEPRGSVAAEHIHPRQEERFEILAGRVRMRVDGDEHDVDVGEVVVVPPNSPHTWWNAADEPARVLAELRPALRTQEFWETLNAWVKKGKTRNGVPTNPLRLAVLAREYRNEVQPVPQKGMPITRLPRPVRNGLLILLAAIGRLFGLRARSNFLLS